MECHYIHVHRVGPDKRANRTSARRGPVADSESTAVSRCLRPEGVNMNVSHLANESENCAMGR